MPAPEPLATEVTVSQLVALLVAVQLHIDGLATGQKFNNLPPGNKIEALEVGH
jgi:hypothetical protein